MLAASVASILAISACGGGGGSSYSGPALPRAAYVARANEVCGSAAQRIKAGASSVFPNPNQAGQQDPVLVEKYANTVVLPALQKEYQDLSTLRPTSDTNPSQTLSALEAAIDGWENDKTIMATENDETFAHFDALATDFGLSTCAATDSWVRAVTSGLLVRPQ